MLSQDEDGKESVCSEMSRGKMLEGGGNQKVRNEFSPYSIALQMQHSQVSTHVLHRKGEKQPQ